jgi:23S rRNA (guanine745-N1)-methyltransferase
VPSAALAAAAPSLRCPNCGAPLAAAVRALSCANGHSFDVARQGYVALPPPGRATAGGDSGEMVAARGAFLGAGHYAPISAAVSAAARAVVGGPATGSGGWVVDLGAGTGHHLAALLETLPAWQGIALDSSRPALRRAARAHPRIAAVACDVWVELPLQDGTADLVVDVFAPRNGPEIARVVSARGALVLVTPTPRHLKELVPELGMLAVDADKQARVHATLSPHLSAVSRTELDFDMTLGHADVQALVAMGPSARHLDSDDLRTGIAKLPAEVGVTASVSVETFVGGT